MDKIWPIGCADKDAGIWTPVIKEPRDRPRCFPRDQLMDDLPCDGRKHSAGLGCRDQDIEGLSPGSGQFLGNGGRRPCLVRGLGMNPKQIAFGAGTAGLAQALGRAGIFLLTPMEEGRVSQASRRVEQTGYEPWARCGQLPSSSVGEAASSSSRRRWMWAM